MFSILALHFASLVQAAPPVLIHDAVRIETLANSPGWLGLLVYGKNKKSEVESPSFFLSPDGHSNPVAEMNAMIAGLDAPWPGDTDNHPRCRFPARYLWLAKQLQVSNFTALEGRCHRLSKWVAIDRLSSISLIFVSGYMANPASTFGHALFRLKTGAADDDNLLDLTINFGAQYPEDENIIKYMFRGLFGGYQSGFSDKHFYSDEKVYARTEMRDMWEYQLSLTEYERTLLAFHLWELLGVRFRYYFLTKNCALRMAQVLETALSQPGISKARAWYVPIELFHRIHGVEKTSRPGLIAQIRFLPSSQRELFREFAILDFPERQRANMVIKSKAENLAQILSSVSAKRKIAILDALLAYYQFKTAGPESDLVLPILRAREMTLRERLHLAPERGPIPKTKGIPSPAMLSAPALTGLGVGIDAKGRFGMRTKAAVFSYDQSGLNGLGDGELVVMEVVAESDLNRATRLNSIDLIRLRKLNSIRPRIQGETQLSWQGGVGLIRERNFRDGQYSGRSNFGIGPAVKLSESLKLYSMLDVWAMTTSSPVGLEPNFGIIASWGRVRLWTQGGGRYHITKRMLRSNVQFDGRFQISQNVGMRFEYHNSKFPYTSSFSLYKYW